MLRNIKNKLFGRNIIIGKNNYISPKAIIHNNVIIGDNNKIYDNVIIFPNTKIGNNNYIYPRNYIGDFPIDTNIVNNDYEFKNVKGVEIGNNNLFHLENYILSGIKNKTYVGNNNKILGKNLIGHDVIIKNNVTIYPRCLIGGYVILMDNSNIGMGVTINQKLVIGSYSMIAANNPVVKNIFPYYININNKIHKLNFKKTPKEINDYDFVLRLIDENFNNKNFELEQYYNENKITYQIKNDLNDYIKNMNLIIS
jgi:acyl-[acyl carrier protein]--UDP-N-acetylglucosamine O-acyltransferase